jgi:molybdenum cofactor guanylyltransferase
MGKDKGTLIFNGQPLIQKVLNSLPPLDEIILVLRDEKQYQSYQEILSSYERKVKVTFDHEKDQGPLVGILAGLSSLESDRALLIPCDSPGITPGYVEGMLDRPLEGCDALAPRWPDGRIEPLHAVYRKTKTIPTIEKLLKSGVRDVKSIFNHLRVCYLDAESVNNSGGIFFNLNRPQDLEKKLDK